MKSSSYWQSWKLWNEDGSAKRIKVADDSATCRIRFPGLKVGDAGAPSPSNTTYKSDLHVFAFQAERDPTLWNALDLTQWEFYMLTRNQLERMGYKSVALATLRKICGNPMTAGEFRTKGRMKLEKMAAQKKALSAAGAK